MKRPKKHKAKRSVTILKTARTSALAQPSKKEEALALVTAKVHSDILGATAYRSLSRSLGLTGEYLDAAPAALLSLQEELQAKNGIERMALTQMIMAQGRTAWLTDFAMKQTLPTGLATVLEACEKASSTYVRLMRAFQECRQPKMPVATVSIGIGQANVAAQQLVQNSRNQKHSSDSDEQTGIEKRVIDAEVISVDEARPKVTESRNPEKSAMDEKHRPKNSKRKSQSRNEFGRTRRKVCHRG